MTDAPFNEERARRRMEWQLRELAANLLRVIAGAGRDYQLLGDATRFLETTYEWSQGRPGEDPNFGPLLSEWWNAANHQYFAAGIIQAALRFVAADLIGQAAQRSLAENKLVDALTDWQREREERSRLRGGP